MTGLKDKITRKIYIIIGIVLCSTSICMSKAQTAISYAKFNEYKQEVEDNIALNESLENEEKTVDVVVEEINIGDFTDESYWNVILVNRNQTIPEDRPVKLGKLSNGKMLDARVIDITNQMIEDAANDGVNLIVCSAYRSYSYQSNLYNKEVNKWLSMGYSQEDANIAAKQNVALPGTSEHQLGLAIDFITDGYMSLSQDFENSDAFKWLETNGSKYGWILRYPRGKENITGISYEPWHWRYLGPELAELVKKSNLCYEEFLNKDPVIN